MSRSQWKAIHANKKAIQNRANFIVPEFLNKEVFIHNGLNNKTFLVSLDHIGHKFGEFVLTKKIAKYKKNAK